MTAKKAEPRELSADARAILEAIEDYRLILRGRFNRAIPMEAAGYFAGGIVLEELLGDLECRGLALKRKAGK